MLSGSSKGESGSDLSQQQLCLDDGFFILGVADVVLPESARKKCCFAA